MVPGRRRPATDGRGRRLSGAGMAAAPAAHAPATRDRFERADRIGWPAALRHPGFKMEAVHRPPFWSRWRPRARAVPHRRQRRRRHHRRRSCGTTTTRWSWWRRDGIERDLPIPGRELDGIHQAGGYLPWGNRLQLGDDVPGPTASRRSRPRARRSSSSAVVTPGRLSGHRAPAGAAVSVHQFEIMPRPAEGALPSRPVADHPLMFRVSSAHEEGGERLLGQHRGVPGHRRRGLGAEGARVVAEGRQVREGRGFGLRGRRTSFSWPWASSGRSEPAC